MGDTYGALIALAVPRDILDAHPVFHHIAIGQIGIVIYPSGSGNCGSAQPGRAVVYPHHLTNRQRSADGARQIQAGVVGDPARGEITLYPANIVIHRRDRSYSSC